MNRLSLEHDWGILSNAAHLGATHTNLQITRPTLGKANSGSSAIMNVLMRITMRIPGFWQEIEQGCLPVPYAATNPQAIGSGYYGPDGYFELPGIPKLASIPRPAKNEATARKLWGISEELTGFHFPMSIN